MQCLPGPEEGQKGDSSCSTERRGPGSSPLPSPVIPSRRRPSLLLVASRLPNRPSDRRQPSVARSIPVPPPIFSAGPIIRHPPVLGCMNPAQSIGLIEPKGHLAPVINQFVGLGASWSRRAAVDRPTSPPVRPRPRGPRADAIRGSTPPRRKTGPVTRPPPPVRYASGIHLAGL